MENHNNLLLISIIFIDQFLIWAKKLHNIL